MSSPEGSIQKKALGGAYEALGTPRPLALKGLALRMPSRVIPVQFQFSLV